jgi:tRNA G10  N-methylase Trm11
MRLALVVPVWVSGDRIMLTPRSTAIREASEQIPPSAKGIKPEERGPIVLEYSGQGRELLYQYLDEAERRLVAGGVLYLTVPSWLDGEPVVAALRARFSRIGPLNVGSNPRLQDNDVHTRSGYLCVK